MGRASPRCDTTGIDFEALAQFSVKDHFTPNMTRFGHRGTYDINVPHTNRQTYTQMDKLHVPESFISSHIACPKFTILRVRGVLHPSSLYRTIRLQ